MKKPTKFIVASSVALVLLGVGIYVYIAGKKDGELFEAVASGNYNEVKKWIRKGADVNARLDSYPHSHYFFLSADGDGATPLHLAITFDKLDIAELLINNGADVNAKNSDGATPVHLAITSDKGDIAELLINKGADVNAKSIYGDTPLHYTALKNAISTDILANIANILLISKDADVNAKTTLKNAVSTASLLISKGADVNAKNVWGSTPLHTAAYNNAVKVADLLISKGADVNAKNNNGEVPLHYAVRANAVDITNFLISKGADINAQDTDGDTLLYWAIEGNKNKFAKVLINNGAHVNDDGDWLITGVANRLISIHNSMNHDDFMNYRAPGVEDAMDAVLGFPARRLYGDEWNPSLMPDNTIEGLKKSVLHENPNRERDSASSILRGDIDRVTLGGDLIREAQRKVALRETARIQRTYGDGNELIAFINKHGYLILTIMLLWGIVFFGMRASTKRKR